MCLREHVIPACIGLSAEAEEQLQDKSSELLRAIQLRLCASAQACQGLPGKAYKAMASAQDSAAAPAPELSPSDPGAMRQVSHACHWCCTRPSAATQEHSRAKPGLFFW